MGSLLAPPYDVVTPDQAREYLARSPYNALRLDLGMADGGAAGPGDWEQAAALFRRWLAEGILAVDPEPSVYVMRHRYRAPDGTEGELLAAFAGLRVGSGPERAALPHERTLPEVWSERLKQLTTCRAHFSPILAVVPDASGAFREALARACEPEPVWSAESPFGGLLELWVHAAREAPGAAVLDAAAGSLAEQPAIIADGHHRFEAASRAADRDAGGAGQDGPTASQYVLAGLTPMEHGGLTILPIHRVVGPGSEAVRERLRLGLYEYLTPVVPAELPAELAGALREAAASPEQAAALVRRLRGVLGRTVVAVYWGGRRVEFLAEPAKAAWRAKNSRPELPGAANDVLLLHRGPLAGYELQAELAPPKGAPAPQDRPWVGFTAIAAEAAQAVDRGQAAACIFVSPVTLADVRDVAVAGKRMPQKSTYFYPKLTSGLVMADLTQEVLPWPPAPGSR